MGINAGKLLKKAGLGALEATLGIGIGGKPVKLPEDLPEGLAEDLVEVIAAGVYKGLKMAQEGVPQPSDEEVA